MPPATDRIVLSHDGFFDGVIGDWDALLATGRAVAATMNEDRIVLQPVAMPECGDTVVLRGNWRVPGLDALPGGPAGARFLLPYLYNVTGFVLPNAMLPPPDTTADRSGADVLAERLFQGLGAGAALSLHVVEGARRGVHIRKFRRHYHQILKARFPDPVFAEGNAQEIADIVLANGFASTLKFADPVLEDGARHLRGLTARP